MTSKTALFVAFVVAGALYVFSGRAPAEPRANIVIHKSATCGCCGVYASYLKRLGYGVTVDDTDNLEPVKRELGVPASLESCHTTEVNGYVVEGHVPEEAIAKLLIERPDIRGIGMAGMPAGSPGMGGGKTGPFVIYQIARDGSRGPVFATL